MVAYPLTADAVSETPRSLECDRAIVAGVQRDGAAFAAVYERYVDALYRYVLHCCGDPLLAEDIVAETFQRALEHVQHFEWRGVPMSAWLYRIASNALAAHYRRHTLPAADLMEVTVPDTGPGPEQAVVRRERCQEVRAAVAALPLLQRQAILLRYGHDLPLKEIALILGRSEGAIKQHLHRAQDTLRQRLAADRRSPAAVRAGTVIQASVRPIDTLCRASPSSS